MRSDTHSLVRVLTRDDPAQGDLAVPLMETSDLFACKTIRGSPRSTSKRDRSCRRFCESNESRP